MNLEEARKKYPEIDSLFSLLEEKKMILRVSQSSSDLKTVSFIEVELTTPQGALIISVDDEYKDSELENSALLLQLVIFMIEEYEDCEDFSVWSTTYGLNASNHIHLEWFKRLGEITPRIREIISTDFSGISDYDWQLNAGAAQALRKLQE